MKGRTRNKAAKEELHRRFLAHADHEDLGWEKELQVLAAAKELFGRFGFKKTTVDEIAERAGISKRTLYEVFKSKEKILAELVMFEARSFRRFCLAQLERLTDPVEKFRAFCELSSRYFADNPFLGRVAADDERLFKPFLGSELHLVEAGIEHMVTELVEEGIANGVFQAADVPETVGCIMTLFRNFTFHSSEHGPGHQEWVPFILRAVTRTDQ
jgi:AcrR family transcriptional regulator